MATPLEILRARRQAIDNVALQNVANQTTPQNRLGANIMNLLVDTVGGFKNPDQKAYEDYTAGQEQFNQARQAQGGGAFTGTPAPYAPDYNPQQDLSKFSPEMRGSLQGQNLISEALGADPEQTRSIALRLAQLDPTNPMANVLLGESLRREESAKASALAEREQSEKLGKRTAIASLLTNPSDPDLRTKAAMAGVTPDEIKKLTIENAKAASAAGKQAIDLGFAYGTEPYQKKVQELLDKYNQSKGTKIDINMPKTTDVVAVDTAFRNRVGDTKKTLAAITEGYAMANELDRGNPKAGPQLDRLMAQMAGDSNLSALEVATISKAAGLPQTLVDSVEKMFSGLPSDLTTNQKRSVLNAFNGVMKKRMSESTQDFIRTYGAQLPPEVLEGITGRDPRYDYKWDDKLGREVKAIKENK